MRNLLFLVLPVMFACGPTAEDIAALKAQEAQLNAAISKAVVHLQTLQQRESKATDRYERLQASTNELSRTAALLSAQVAGKKVRYVLKVTLKQSHFSLNPLTHAKDAWNSETFELFTDKDSYDRAKVGEELFSSFRTGSAILHGSWGDWKIRIDGKRTIVE